MQCGCGHGEDWRRRGEGEGGEERDEVEAARRAIDMSLSSLACARKKAGQAHSPVDAALTGLYTPDTLPRRTHHRSHSKPPTRAPTTAEATDAQAW